jgi:hypothetical protein
MTEIKAKLIVCRDDETIIKHMKKTGVWDRMLQHSKAGSYASIIHEGSLYVWHGALEGIGYRYMQSSNPAELTPWQSWPR